MGITALFLIIGVIFFVFMVLYSLIRMIPQFTKRRASLLALMLTIIGGYIWMNNFMDHLFVPMP
ncbi:TRAP-type C4-dicarboxylate transport system permease small subunit [Paenibacillus shirakamiensis]|uniref:TRAP-type C4-dicarboxylate transport system permease small subunit n=1 Tax=Paenibacillus shirakamiensis TaxID=1265935 RepID=A0ABS4JKH9_9BACL|nr:hypothetical protein [Paenibacillus shirakamiensis]MBP2002223.1 TRAP-type C4-dicarboxylate transport system permease small subunit [Paenibacillus shirakamiensis]